MPRVAQFRIAAIGELCRQLTYAPAAALRRQMDAAEKLAAEIRPGQVYPQDFVIYRITGYRPDRGEATAALVGEALRGDLVTLILRFSSRLELPADYNGRQAVRLDALAGRLGVSSKTLQRLRRHGLVCHHVVFDDGMKRLACFEDAADRFTQRHHDRLQRARSFSRIDGPVHQTMIDEARRQRLDRGVSLNAAARNLARKYGRAPETVRSILLKHDRSAGEPIFPDAGPLSGRDRRLIHRAARWGVPSQVLSRRFGKTPPTIHRAINRSRLDALLRLQIQLVECAAIRKPDAEEALLATAAASEGLGPALVQRDALELIAAARRLAAPSQESERAMLLAYNLLKRRARQGIEALGPHPSALRLDRIETDLRWAAMLKRCLVELALPAAVTAIERDFGRPIGEQPTGEIRSLLRLGINTIAATTEGFDADRPKRLAPACGLATNIALAARGGARSGARAAQRHAPGSLAIRPFEDLCPWQAWLELGPGLAEHLAELPDDARRLVARRFGLEGSRPRTLGEIAEASGSTPSVAARSIARAERQLRRLRRRGLGLPGA